MNPLLEALDDGQEVEIFKISGGGEGYCVRIHGDCWVEVRGKNTLEEAVSEAAEKYQEWDEREAEKRAEAQSREENSSL